MNRDDMWILSERAKELECMYAVDDILQNQQLSKPKVMEKLIEVIPSGFSCPEACRVRIRLNEDIYEDSDFGKAEILYKASIKTDSEEIGSIEVGYIKSLLEYADFEILQSEIKLLTTISNRIARFDSQSKRELSILFDMLQQIDPDMLRRIYDKFRFHLKTYYSKNTKNGVDALFEEIDLIVFPAYSHTYAYAYGEVNSPLTYREKLNIDIINRKLVESASGIMPETEVFDLFTKWIQDEYAFSLVKTADSIDAGVSEILNAIKKYSDAVNKTNRRNDITETWLISELAHRFLTNDEYLIARIIDLLQISEFEPMLKRIIASPKSTGHIGGKGAGLFIAQQIIADAAKTDPLLEDIKTPRTWYIAADQLPDFLHYNNLEELNFYKYNPIDHQRLTYDVIVTKIKSASLPEHTMRMLSLLLDELSDTPIIVRSSSLLEDRTNAAFSGKYKSLFLANRGTKQEKLEKLTDAILEVYSSMYNPDSMQYRKERGLIYFTEQMGVLIQEVVGCEIGSYYMPLYAGVAFSDNVLRWSSRIKKQSGLVRMVMGMGTRAVDRVNDDYPLLFSPGQPGLRINQSPSDVKYYSQKYIDVINLETRSLETADIDTIIKNYGKNIREIGKIVSVYTQSQIENRNSFDIDFSKDDLVVTFEGAISGTDMPKKIMRMLTVLSEKMDTPVDIEFAYDGKNIYLLQCRPQSSGAQSQPAPIPQHLDSQDILFTAKRFISNAKIDGITHIVYVDADEYNALDTKELLLDVGKAVGLLNDMFHRKKYILMGPGRWGSRGDIKLGVRVTYSDICNTAALIEIAKEKHGYVPELSFGTHFFQDLVEEDIAYIPLYPNQPNESDIIFKERFFSSSENILPKILPEYAHLSDVLRVIDVPKTCMGKTLSIYMNAELEKAAAFFTDAPVKSISGKSRHNYSQESVQSSAEKALGEKISGENSQDHWRWRQYMAEQIADNIDMDKFGVKGIYLFGSTDTGDCRLGSDIDLLIHSYGDEAQKNLLGEWLKGWSQALARMNFLKTGYDVNGLLDIHIVTDDDIKNKDSFAIKINSPTDPATALRLNK